MAAHYAPDARVELAVLENVATRAAALTAAGSRVGVLALEQPAHMPADAVMLDPPASVEQYAHVLYGRLRDADRLRLDVLLVVPPPAIGLGAAVADRLQRAAAGSAVSATP